MVVILPIFIDGLVTWLTFYYLRCRLTVSTKVSCRRHISRSQASLVVSTEEWIPRRKTLYASYSLSLQYMTHVAMPIEFPKYRHIVKQVGPLSQANRAAACISFGENISAKSSILRHWRRQMIISLFYVTMFVLNAKLCSIYALILEVFGGLNLVSLSVFEVFCLRNLGLFFKVQWQHYTAAHLKLMPGTH